jgi:hypothetical protein
MKTTPNLLIFLLVLHIQTFISCQENSQKLYFDLEKITLQQDRVLSYNAYGNDYGSPVFPIRNDGNFYWAVKVPLSAGSKFIPLMLMPYTDDIWLSSITKGLLQRVILNCPGDTTKDYQYLNYNITGKPCQLSF